ncbi:Protein of unknown function [Bacillus cytotoxicus]|nr:Protein of unknown function [Bacillus cytotoxicus]
MLGLWEVHNIEDFEAKHFAFGADLEFLKNSKLYLEKHGIEVVGSQRKSRANCPEMDAGCKYIIFGL